MAGETARIFNGAIGAAAIASASELGLLDELEQFGAIQVHDYCRKHDLHVGSVQAILHTLHCHDIAELSRERDVARPGPIFKEAYGDKGYFLWLVRGYGNMLQKLPSIIQDGASTPQRIGRDGHYIALAGSDYGARYVDPYFRAMLEEQPFCVAADFGCGSAERLIHLAETRPDFRGVGVDINEGAVDAARRAIAKADLQDRIQMVHCDVRTLKPEPEFEDVELLFCFFMGHDLWPRSRCVKTFRDIQTAFPRAKRFLFCDTTRSDLPASAELPIFTLGYEFTHAVMGQYIPSVAEWLDLFVDAGWRCEAQREVRIPYSTIFDLRREAR